MKDEEPNFMFTFLMIAFVIFVIGVIFVPMSSGDRGEKLEHCKYILLNNSNFTEEGLFLPSYQPQNEEFITCCEYIDTIIKSDIDLDIRGTYTKKIKTCEMVRWK